MIRQPLISDEKSAIREVIENWVLWRDAGDWDRFATVWHDDGWMTATWFQGPARKFIEVSREGFERGVSILHFLGGFTCEVAGYRAISHTKMPINQRAPVDGVVVEGSTAIDESMVTGEPIPVAKGPGARITGVTPSSR